MFLKEKYLASGEFEKLKARLVAGGDQQEKDMYDDLSAPTVSTSSVFTVLSIAAHEGRKAAVVDIGGAFLNAEMKTGVPVPMRLDRTMSDLLVRLQPSYKKYQDGKGCIVVLLNRALYGCVESAVLWYENLRDTMTGLGYERNPHDICVFNKTGKRGLQCTATVHGARTPATEGLFESRTTALLCTEQRRKDFHSIVAKMLYLAKRTRPECLTAVAYLATRVSRCTEDDWDKLTRLLRYINDTKERGIVFRPGKQGISVRVFINTSYCDAARGGVRTRS
jgi:Reverse transcriptase (RNA-dependent DNA polymerase)